MTSSGLLSVHQAFAGKGVLLTGATGFLAKAVVEKILRDLPDVGQIYLLIRSRVKADGSRIDPRDRLRDEILRNSAFGRLREEMGTGFESFCESKITCVAGDLTAERFGLDEKAFMELARKVQIVINSAATVVFDERLDLALDLNTLGPQRLLELARAAGGVYVHISTAYVSGRRTGLVPEKFLDPLKAIDAQLPKGVLRPEKLDVPEEVERLAALAKSVKEDTQRLIQEKGIAPESEEGRAQLRGALVGAGMRRAQSLGWNDTYTYTKFLGEQLIRLTHDGVPTIVVRPSIIESSLREPEPGWLDGLRMADPIIIGFGKGRLSDFPADKNVVLDIIPADLVVNAVLVSAAHIQQYPAGFDLVTVASSSENPLVFQMLYDHVREYFLKHPMTDRAGKPVAVPNWKFPTVKQYTRKVRNRYLRPVRAASMVLNSPLLLPGARRMRSRLRTLSNTLEQLLYYVDIYGPYVNLHCSFESKRALELLEKLAPEERQRFDFDPRKIRWRHYLQDIHIPGLKRNILRMDSVPRAGAGEGHLLDEEGEAAKKRGAAQAAARGAPQTIIDLSARGAARFGTKPLVEIRRNRASGSAGVSPAPVAGGTPALPGAVLTRYSYEEMFERSSRLARTLIARLGLQPGDRIALAGENCPEWALAYLAISRACCTAVPLDRAMPPPEMGRLLKLVDAKAFICSPSLFSTFSPLPLREGVGGGVPCLNFLNDLEPHPGETWPYPAASIGDRPLREPAPETLASILFTSGTTREPKGVMLTHANLVADAISVAEVLEPMESDRFLSVLPMHHAFEFTCGFLIPMYGGASIHHIETLRGKDVLDTMKLAEITVVLGVPRLFKLFMDGIQSQLAAAGTTGRISVSLGRGMAGAWEMAGGASARKRIFKKVHDAFGGRLRLFVSGGAPLDPEIFEFFKSFGITIAEGYGLTETSPVLTVNPLKASKAGSVGPAIPGVEIQIHNPNNAGIGEVRARGPVVMHGYWQNPAATVNAFENGWFKSGDLGRIDTEGYLNITGRLKDVIITAAGKNVYPDEVEAALQELPGVKELCVVGLPARSGMGEEVAVVIVMDASGRREPIEAAIQRANQALASHQRIARVEFQSGELPKTSTLKVQRNKVREQYASGAGQMALRGATGTDVRASVSSENTDSNIAASGTSSVYLEIARAVAEISPTRIPAADVTPEMKLQMDLGIDSIGLVALLTKLEGQLEIAISHESEGKLFTVRDVMSVVEAAAKRATGSNIAASGTRRIFERSQTRADELQGGLRQSLSKNLLQGMFSTSASIFMNVYLRIECRGREHLPAAGAYILAANHCSHLDSVAIREVLGRRASGLYVMGARDYFFDTRLKSWFFSTFLNALPFDREEHAADSLASCKTVLESGRAILLFPEGTRSASGELQAFKPGIGVLGLELDVPVIPICLKGTFDSLPKGRAIPRPTRIEVRIGPAADFSALKQQRGVVPSNELYRRAAAELRERIEELGEAPEAGG